ncbi:uncharacterized protein LOC123872214 [Maniola jurtina]|uniref:uncharacterized protein LOC123872214 n=1 Tax=Maniola jurtina TaxID=191418 RepID=UPI001E68983E|nr:uncharacterized protein LOC123872214 [Maniola jurtina]
MKEKIEETYDKSNSTKSTKLSAVNNKICCKNASRVEGRDAASCTGSQLLDTVTEMLQQLHITPESERNGTPRSNSKENYLFTDKLKQPCYKIPAIKVNSDQEKYITSNRNVVNETENGAVVKSQNGFPDNQKEMDSLNSVTSTTHALAPINRISLVESSHTILKASLLSKVLQDRKDISNTGNAMSSDIFYFKAPAQLYSKPKASKTILNWTPTTNSASKTISLASTVPQTETFKSASKLELGDQKKQTSLTNSTSVSQMMPRSPIITSSKFEISSGAPSLPCETSTQEISPNKTRKLIKKAVRHVTTSVSSSVFCSPIIGSSLLNSPAASCEVKTSIPKFHTAQPNMTDFEGQTTTVNSNATTIMSSICENTRSVFNKTALMAMFDGSQKLFGTSTLQIPISTVKNSQVSSFPFRNKYAASFELSSKKSSCSQKKLQKNSLIASTEFKMMIPTFCKAQGNATSVCVFGGQETLASMFDQTSTSQNIFKISPKSTAYTFDKTENSTLQFTIGAPPSAFLAKLPAQQQVTSTTNILQKKINLYQYKDYKGALAMFDDAIRLCPDNHTFYTIRALYYMKLGMYKEAIKDVQKVIIYDPSFIDAYICLAKSYLALGDISAADDAISKARAACGEAEGERASEALRELRTLHVDTQRAIAAQDYARAVASCERFLELCPANNTKATKAKCLAMLGKIEQALDIAEECLRHHATEPEALYVKGLCLYYSFQLQQAVDYFHQVISVFPLHLGAVDSLEKANRIQRFEEESTKNYNEGDYEKVITINNDALKIDKTNKEHNVRLYCSNAAIYTRLNKIQLALDAYTAALEVNTNCVTARKNRAKCYTQLGQYENAVSDYEKVYKIDKSVLHEELLNKAKALVQEKEKAYREMVSSVESLVREHKFQEAQKLADECLQIRCSDTDVLYSKGLCFYYTGQYEKAMEYFKKVLNIDPRTHRKAFPQFKKTKSIKVTIKQGDDLFNSNRWIDARCKYKDAKLIDEENWNLSLRMHCRMAETYLKTNEICAAIAEYTSALKFDNTCVEVLRERAKWYSNCELYEKAIQDYLTIYAIDDCEKTKQSTLNFIKILKENNAYKKKIKNAESLIRTPATENVELALKLAEECLEFDSSDTKALCVKGLCLYYKDLYEQALDLFQQILRLRPSHSTALKETKKIKCLMRTLEKGNDAFKNRRWHDALDSFNEALTIDVFHKNFNVRLHCKKAVIYYELKDLQSAINEYTSALELDNNCVEALHERAQCYSKVYRYENAIEDYEKIHVIDKNEINKLCARSSIELLKGKIFYREKLRLARTLIQGRETENVKRALKLAEECLQFNSSDTEALCVKGLCLYYKDQYDQALDQFQQVLVLEPWHPTAVKDTRKIEYLKRTIEKGNDSFSRGRWQEALDNFNMALTIDEDNKNLNVKLYCKRAATVRLMGESNIHAAIRDYTIALVLDNKCVEALRGRAHCYTDVKQYEDAIKDYEKLYTIDQSEEIKQLLSMAKTAYDGQKYRFAQGKAEIGNKLYKRKKFRDALAMYKEAIRLDPETAEYYSKTYSCYINLSILKEALVAAKKAVALDAKQSQSFDGIAKCYLALGELSGADRAITKASDAGFDCTDDRRELETLRRLHAQAQKYVEEQNYDRAIACMDQCLQTSPFCSRVKLIKAECLAMLGKIEQALEIADDCIRLNQSDIDALFVKGLCIYYNEKHEQALKYFKEILRLSPDHVKATAAYKKAKLLQQKKEQGNEEFKMGRWQKALLLYNEALAVDMTHVKVNAKLHFNKATVYWKLKQTQLAADACTSALELDESYVKALTLRATCFTELKEYDCVIDDYEQIYRIDPSDDIKQLLEKAKRSQNEKSLTRNYYTILGVDRAATKPDIIRAYRQLSLVHHPDRHSGRSTFERQRHERRFKEVLEAYTTLSDPVQRRKYDAKCHKVWKNY